MKRLAHVCLLSLAFWASSILSASPISEYIATHQNEQLLLLERLVNINSASENIPGVIQIKNILQPQFAQLGFKTQWISEPPALKRAGTFIATHTGSSKKKILLIGHLDTVFPKNSPFQRFVQQGEVATGPGVIDDKGGDVVILYALKALVAQHMLKNANITVVLTGDEEDSGKPTSISRRPLKEAALHTDIALDFEPALATNAAVIARRGISEWILTTHGKEAHSSQIFQSQVGDGAIFELARILNGMRAIPSQNKGITVNPGIVLGGTEAKENKNNSQGNAFGKKNVVAQIAMAKGDLRFLTLAEKNKTEKRIISIVQSHLPQTQAEIVFQDNIPAMMPTPANYQLLAQYSKISQALGYGVVNAVDPYSRGAGDISYIAQLSAANLGGLGPVGSHMHSTQETLIISSLVMQTQRAAMLLNSLLQEGEKRD